MNKHCKILRPILTDLLQRGYKLEKKYTLIRLSIVEAFSIEGKQNSEKNTTGVNYKVP